LPTARIIVDAGSGFSALGQSWHDDSRPTLLLLSHLHWDHIMGFAMFPPFYASPQPFAVWGALREGEPVAESLLRLNEPPYWPFKMRERIRTPVVSRVLRPSGRDRFGGIEIRWTEVAHPGGCSAFGFDIDGVRVVFSGDVEYAKTNQQEFRAFCRGVDLLIMDAQYTDEEYADHIGWGHSTHTEAARLAAEESIGTLLLTHHDPEHEDDVIDAMVAEARTIFPRTAAAAERQEIPLDNREGVPLPN